MVNRQRQQSCPSPPGQITYTRGKSLPSHKLSCSFPACSVGGYSSNQPSSNSLLNSLGSYKGTWLGRRWESKEQRHPFEQHPTIKLIRCNITPYPYSRAALFNLPPLLGVNAFLLRWKYTLKNDVHLLKSDDCQHTESNLPMVMEADNIATSSVKDNHKEVSMLGDCICFTTTEVIVQSQKELLFHHFWAANAQEVIRNCTDTK